MRAAFALGAPDLMCARIPHYSGSQSHVPFFSLPRPLHIAARNGLASVVQALLSRGATVLAVDEEGGWGPKPPASPGFGVRDTAQEVTS